MELPPEDVSLSEVQHEVMDEARRLAPESPLGQKPIECARHKAVFRVQHSRWRGASWVDLANGVMWVLGYHIRREGSKDDAYEYFCQLYEDGRLLPDEADYRRDRAEAFIRLAEALAADVERHAMEARYQTGEEVEARLIGEIHAVLYVTSVGGGSEIWLAISRRLDDGDFIDARLSDLLFAQYSEALGALFTPAYGEWPTGRKLEWYEIGWLGFA